MAVTPMRRIRVVWTGVTGSPFLSTWFFDAGVGTAQQNVSELEQSLVAMSGLFSNQVTCGVDTIVDTVDPVTGQLTATETIVSTPIVGTATSDPLPRGTQGFMLLNTGIYRLGRQIRGKFYLPTPCEEHNAGDGQPLVTYRDGMLPNIEALIQQGTVNLVVYSRAAGQHYNIVGQTFGSGWARLSTTR